MNAGVDALPGGGAEIFHPKSEKNLYLKLLVIHGLKFIVYYSKGLPSNAILYGHLNPIVMLLIMSFRDLQDDTNGFFAFIPVSFNL